MFFQANETSKNQLFLLMLVNFHNQKNVKDHKNKIWPLKNVGVPQGSLWFRVVLVECGL